MARFVKFETQVFACSSNAIGEWEYLPAKPDGTVFINPDMVNYIAPTPNGEVVCVFFGPKEGDDCVYLRQSLGSVASALTEKSRAESAKDRMWL